MLYWSYKDIPRIVRFFSSADTQEQLLTKKLSNALGYAVSSTGYGLLSMLQNSEDPEEMNRVQLFLQEQHLSVGGFASSMVSELLHFVQQSFF